MSDIQSLSMEDLFAWRKKYEDERRQRKDWVDQIDAELDRRLNADLSARLSDGYGQKSFEKDGIKITGKIPRTVSWDSDKLKAAGIQMGPDLADTLLSVKITAKEKEIEAARKLGVLSDGHMQAIEAAKTVKIGKPTYDAKIEE